MQKPLKIEHLIEPNLELIRNAFAVCFKASHFKAIVKEKVKLEQFEFFSQTQKEEKNEGDEDDDH